jgi:hypothetical protein
MQQQPDCGGPKIPRGEIALFCFALLVAAAVWVWGFIHLPIWAAVLLWWWPSIFAGALAAFVVVAGIEARRWLRGDRRRGQTKVTRGRRPRLESLSGDPKTTEPRR